MNDSCSRSVISASGAYSCAEYSIRKGCRFKTPPGRLHRDLVSFRLQITFFMGLESLCWGTMDSFYGRPLLKLVGFFALGWEPCPLWRLPQPERMLGMDVK